MQVTTIGLDLAKHWFQIYGIDARGGVAVRRKLRRGELLTFFQSLQPCLIGMEACATAHHWARELSALGHEVKLMPPAYVKAYIVQRPRHDLPPELLREAAVYYRSLSRGIARKAVLIEQLAKLREGDPRSESRMT